MPDPKETTPQDNKHPSNPYPDSSPQQDEAPEHGKDKEGNS